MRPLSFRFRGRLSAALVALAIFSNSAVAHPPALLFQLNVAGFSNDLVSLAGYYPYADAALDSTIAALQAFKTSYPATYALINPAICDKTKLIRVLDKLTAANISFVFDVYASDNYFPPPSNPLCETYPQYGVPLDYKTSSPTTDTSSVQYYRNRYTRWFVGLRLHEIASFEALGHIAGFYQHSLSEGFVSFAHQSGMFVQWNGPSWDPPYLMSPNGTGPDAQLKQSLYWMNLDLARMMVKYPGTIVPTYATNDGTWICRIVDCSHTAGAPSPRWTPLGWQTGAFADWVGLVTTGLPDAGFGPSSGTAGFGISDQSWMPGIPYLSSASPLNAELQTHVADIIAFALNAKARGAGLIQFEPYYYFFNWNNVTPYIKDPGAVIDNLSDPTMTPNWYTAGTLSDQGCALAIALGVNAPGCSASGKSISQPRGAPQAGVFGVAKNDDPSRGKYFYSNGSGQYCEKTADWVSLPNAAYPNAPIFKSATDAAKSPLLVSPLLKDQGPCGKNVP